MSLSKWSYVSFPAVREISPTTDDLSDCNSNHTDYYFRTDGVLFSNGFSQVERVSEPATFIRWSYQTNSTWAKRNIIFMVFLFRLYTIKFFLNFTGFDVEYSATIVGISQRSFPGYLEFTNTRVFFCIILKLNEKKRDEIFTTTKKQLFYLALSIDCSERRC